MKKKLLLIGGIAAMLFSSCDQDITNVINLPGGEASNTPTTQKEITFTASMDGMNTRAVETTIANLDSFRVTSMVGSYVNPPAMQNVKYTSSDNGNTWTTKEGTYYWQLNVNNNFFAYSPDVLGNASAIKLNQMYPQILDFSPNKKAATQQDLVYAATTVYRRGGDKDASVNLEFKHALAEISIKAKNSNADYTVQVTGVQLGNIESKGTFQFPALWFTPVVAAKWILPETSQKTSYETTWSNPVTLTSEASSLDAANVPFMLIPQQLTANNDNLVKGSYIAVKIKVIKDNQTIYEGHSFVGIDTTWEMSKHYVYTLDFSNGLGKNHLTEDIAVKEVTASVSVEDWVSKDENISYGKD